MQQSHWMIEISAPAGASGTLSIPQAVGVAPKTFVIAPGAQQTITLSPNDIAATAQAGLRG